MSRLALFPARHPIAFGFVTIFALIVMLFVSALLGNLWPGEDVYGQPGAILGRLISTAILLAVLARLGWLSPAGFTSFGSWRTWLISLLLLAYAMAGSGFAMTGGLDFTITGRMPSGRVILFIIAAAFMEEVAFRGLILQGFIRAWGSARQGILKSVLFSALCFCSMHLLDILSGRALIAVLLQSLGAFFLGVFLAVLVLRGKSIYPAVLFHGLLNLFGYVSFGSQGLEPTPAAWLSLSLFMLPLAVYSLYLIVSSYEQVTPVNVEAT